MSKQPNILVVQADQLSALAMRAYGGYCEAPAFEALAGESLLFDNAYCNFPLCAPSRLSMMTGRRAFDISAYDNAAELPSGTPTFAHYLRRKRYRTCLSGKMHFIGADQLHGFEERLTTEIYPADFAWLPNWHAQQQNFAPIRNTIERAGVSAWNMQLAYDEDVAFQAVRKIYEYARNPDQPFCLVASFTHPHPPFLTTPEYWEKSGAGDIPPPRVSRLDDDSVDPHSARCRRLIGVQDTDVDDEMAYAARRAYRGMIRYFDDKLAELLNALDQVSLLDSTAIVVVADHGEMLGERGLWAKDCFFEWAVRIPMLVRVPGGGETGRVSRNTSLLDLAPTLFDLAGVGNENIASPLHGNSLLDSNAPDCVKVEYSAESAAAPMVMIREGQYKYIQADGDPAQSFERSN
ncbi:MAG: choline-sulfatase, partial [Pseudomonadota bacterium]